MYPFLTVSSSRRALGMLVPGLLALLVGCTQATRPAVSPPPPQPALGAVEASTSAPTSAPATTTVAPAPTIPPTVPVVTPGMRRWAGYAAYLRDPAAYCAIVDPGRCHQIAQPAADVPALTTVGAGTFLIGRGEVARLQAQTDPGMPVTFSSQGLGEFPASKDTSITVAADANGLAVADFTAPPGTVGQCLVVAGSPVRGTTATFLVSIKKDAQP